MAAGLAVPASLLLFTGFWLFAMALSAARLPEPVALPLALAMFAALSLPAWVACVALARAAGLAAPRALVLGSGAYIGLGVLYFATRFAALPAQVLLWPGFLLWQDVGCLQEGGWLWEPWPCPN